MIVKMTNAEAVLLYNTLSGLQVEAGPKFRYGVAKNKAILKPHVESLQEASVYPEDDEEHKKFVEERDALLKEYSVNADGEPVTQENRMSGQLQRIVPPENQGAYTKAVEELQEKYKELVEKMADFQRTAQKMLSDTEEFDLRLIKAEDLPSDPKFPQSSFNVMFPIIEDPEKVKAKNKKAPSPD